ncbi:hypothetical protein [Duganella phyllosphaerae]|uniref:CdiA C-terminal domain-containing protein n=1 Tax=Duganella phyllosphaerae TaxID=762836 RepID=UPI00114D3A54|nr:hypothetical protein [Duganella phyllosphaerae]
MEYLPNISKKGANPDLRIDGALADVYSPSGSNVLTIRDTIDDKVKRQAPNIVINLEDSSLSISDVAQFIQRNPVDKLESLIIIKDGNVVLL